MMSFVRRTWPYFVGFAIVEAFTVYYFGPKANYSTDFAGIFVIWMFYAWTTREQEHSDL
jgi:RsiW-degrading membrane proteinase PrsW (M82 family)